MRPKGGIKQLPASTEENNPHLKGLQRSSKGGPSSAGALPARMPRKEQPGKLIREQQNKGRLGAHPKPQLQGWVQVRTALVNEQKADEEG